MNKIINGVASEYDMPMKYENKSTTIFIDAQDMEERYGEQLYQEYLEKENQQLKEKVNQLEKKVKHWVDIYTELKKHIEKAMKTTVKDSNTYKAYKNIIDKMQELENGKNE